MTQLNIRYNVKDGAELRRLEESIATFLSAYSIANKGGLVVSTALNTNPHTITEIKPDGNYSTINEIFPINNELLGKMVKAKPNSQYLIIDACHYFIQYKPEKP